MVRNLLNANTNGQDATEGMGNGQLSSLNSRHAGKIYSATDPKIARFNI